MCNSCSWGDYNRRQFMSTAGAIGAAGFLSDFMARRASAEFKNPATESRKKPARVRVVFLYPPAEVVNAGKLEDSWSKHNWFTWPGNQFEPEKQEQKFHQKIDQLAQKLGVDIEFAPQAIYQQAKVNEFIEQAKASALDAVLVVNFWNTFSKWAAQIATQSAPTAIVYHSVGSNHQLPPDYLRNAEGMYYIHSIENWTEIERGLRAVQAKKMLAQSRLLRVSGRYKEVTHQREENLGVDLVQTPAEEFNSLFDSIDQDDAMVRSAMEIKRQAGRVMDVTDEYFVEALRAHRAVEQIMQRHEADAITIECLFLKHRKPCISFAINNGNLIPCGCENHLDGTLTLMLGRWLLERAGFLHNPEFDTSDNLYFASHCTCAWKLHGPEKGSQEYMVRPFFHQLPKTPALDVQWNPKEPVLLTKYIAEENVLSCWIGRVRHSPTSPPTGGCATRVLMEFDGVEDVCDTYRGPHPILFCGDRAAAKRLKAFAKMYRVKLEGNV